MYDRCQSNDARVRDAFRDLLLKRAKVEACEARLLSAAREQREGLVQEQMNLEQEWACAAEAYSRALSECELRGRPERT
jgi:hypothetical protein